MVWLGRPEAGGTNPPPNTHYRHRRPASPSLHPYSGRAAPPLARVDQDGVVLDILVQGPARCPGVCTTG
jgi:hypothetical protein